MSGRNIAKTTYMRSDLSHPRLHEAKIDVLLVAYPDYLSLHRRSDNRAVLSIPWHNIKSIWVSNIEKRGLDELLEQPKWAFKEPGNMYHDGVKVEYWDDDVQRDVEVFFKTGGRKNAEKLMTVLWRARDDAIR